MEIFLELSGKEHINSYRSYRSFLTDGILLKSGKALKADIITATGFISIWWSQNSTGFAAI
jgi:hypothetical protein